MFKQQSIWLFMFTPQVWRADAPLSEAHGCKAVQMQSLRAEFRAQWPPCVAHEKTSTKAHEELSQRESQQQQEQEERWKSFKKNVIETGKVAERNKMPSP